MSLNPPFEIDGTRVGPLRITGRDAEYVCETYLYRDAEKICTILNSHGPLVEALALARTFIPSKERNFAPLAITARARKAERQIAAALALAETESET